MHNLMHGIYPFLTSVSSVSNGNLPMKTRWISRSLYISQAAQLYQAWKTITRYHGWSSSCGKAAATIGISMIWGLRQRSGGNNSQRTHGSWIIGLSSATTIRRRKKSSAWDHRGGLCDIGMTNLTATTSLPSTRSSEASGMVYPRKR